MAILDAFQLDNQPSEILRAHQKFPMYAIIHFGLNTFTNREWGYGDESPALFDPTDFDADQIAQACVEGGLKGLILVCKHHDGFCLWPTKTTRHNISASPFRHGHGDLVREFADACRRNGLAFGTYCSPWDRNHPAYGTPAYLEVFREQLRELHTGYGELFEVWFDGANGGDGYYGGARELRKIDPATYYDWQHTWQLVRQWQPSAVIFSDIGPDLRWVGNEKGLADPNSTALFTPRPKAEGLDPAPGYLDTTDNPSGQPDGQYYMPAECDVPLRPGWFYHPEEDTRQRSIPELVKIYLRSVGCGAYLNLGLAPDRTGRLHPNDVARLREFRQTIAQIEASPLTRQIVTLQPNQPLAMEIGHAGKFNLLDLAEMPESLESTRKYCLEALTGNGRQTLTTGTSIGLRRLKVCPETAATKLALTLTETRGNRPVRLAVSLRYMPDALLTQNPLSAFLPANAIALPLPGDQRTFMEWTLPKPVNIHGFLYQPPAEPAAGLPYQYCFEARIGGQWLTLAKGEFANLQANPLAQQVNFTPATAEAVRFNAVRLTDDGNRLACAGFYLIPAKT